jgi:hypothetical protein
MPILRAASLVALLVGAAAVPAVCQDNYEIQVYGSELVAPRATMVELHSNFTTRGSMDPFGSYHALHETVEITHGFNDFFELGFYQFTSLQPTGGFQYVGNHIRPRFAIPARYHLPVGLSLSQEIGYERSDFSPDTWTWEVRPIIDKTMGRLYWSINPVLGFVLSGPNKGKSPDFSPQVQVGFDLSSKFNLAVEYYGTTGTLAHSEPFNQTQQYLFPALNINFGPAWEFNIATGIPLTSVTDRVAVKMIIGHRFGASK